MQCISKAKLLPGILKWNLCFGTRQQSLNNNLSQYIFHFLKTKYFSSLTKHIPQVCLGGEIISSAFEILVILLASSILELERPRCLQVHSGKWCMNLPWKTGPVTLLCSSRNYNIQSFIKENENIILCS